MPKTETCFTLFALLAAPSLPALNAESAPYTESYRPQFHFSPRHGWVGDPNGTIHYNNKYHVFWWGHAISDDLVYWNELPWPMRGGERGYDYYSGAVVVDTPNSTDFSTNHKSAMVAIYTGHHRESGNEDIRLAHSLDYRFFQDYDRNPVLTNEAEQFRDPEVFWDANRQRWIMIVSLSVERKLNFYSSEDLVAWTFESSFGPINARSGSWEVSGLLPLQVEDTNETKWLLFCGMGPNKVQYWVGDFDGTAFTLDPKTEAFCLDGTGLDGELFAGFNKDDYENWTAEIGSSFGRSPARSATPTPANASGYLGDGYASSSNGGPGALGTLTSPDFTIQKNCINFLIGGSDSPETSCELIIDGKTVRSMSGQNDNILRWQGWDVSPFLGKVAHIRIRDDSNRSAPAYIMVDHIMFSDTLNNTSREHANWVDGGSDFYAPRVYRNYDTHESPDTWIAWMGNWQYANDVPTPWGKGALSLPRNISLKKSDRGYSLTQNPISELKKLRQTSLKLPPSTITGTQKLGPLPISQNTYEIEAVFEIPNQKGDFGFNLCVGNHDQVTLGYNVETSNLYLDRTRSGEVDFSPHFGTTNYIPLNNQNTQLKLRVYVDQSSIEVFVNDGEATLTSLIFPNAENLGIQLFSRNGSTQLQSLDFWPLSSIWD